MERMNIKPSNCKFYVNKEKRKVVCVMDKSRDLLDWFLWNNTSQLPIDSDEVELPSRFIGIATCSAEDEWDEAFGRRLAFTRMKSSLYKCFFKQANRYLDNIDKELNRLTEVFNAFGTKVSRSVDNDMKYIESYLKNE